MLSTLHGCCRGLQSAAKGLRGDGPLVSIRLEVLRDQPASTSASETTGSRAAPAGEPGPLQSPFAQGAQALAPGGAQPAAQPGPPPSTAGEGSGVHQQPVSPTARGDGSGAQPRGFASSLLSRWGFFKRGSEEGEATVAQALGSDKTAAARLRFQQPYVRVHFKVGCLEVVDGCDMRLHRGVAAVSACVQDMWGVNMQLHKAAAACLHVCGVF